MAGNILISLHTTLLAFFISTNAAMCMSRWSVPESLEAAQIPVESAVLFSSTSAVWSQSGAGHYAAANSHLDALAATRQHAGLPALAVRFGPFAETGMAASHASALTAMGLPGLKPRQVCMPDGHPWHHVPGAPT